MADRFQEKNRLAWGWGARWGEWPVADVSYSFAVSLYFFSDSILHLFLVTARIHKLRVFTNDPKLPNSKQQQPYHYTEHM